MKIKLVKSDFTSFQNCIPTVISNVRLTLPCMEEFAKHGAIIHTLQTQGIYAVDLSKVKKIPPIFYPVRVPHPVYTNLSMVGIRLRNEPKFPLERPCDDIWIFLNLYPCPVCSAPLFWNEYGSVPGAVVCNGDEKHHWLLS